MRAPKLVMEYSQGGQAMVSACVRAHVEVSRKNGELHVRNGNQQSRGENRAVLIRNSGRAKKTKPEKTVASGKNGRKRKKRLV